MILYVNEFSCTIALLFAINIFLPQNIMLLLCVHRINKTKTLFHNFLNFNNHIFHNNHFNFVRTFVFINKYVIHFRLTNIYCFKPFELNDSLAKNFIISMLLYIQLI